VPVLAVRRLYVYGVTFAAQWVVLTGLANLLRVLVELALGLPSPDPSFLAAPEYFRQRVSLFGALLLVGTPIWAGHWWAASRLAAPDDPAGAAERRSLVRQAYLYASLLGAAGIVAFQAIAAIQELLAVWLDLPGPRGPALSATVLGKLFWCAAAAALWGYLWRLAQQDRRRSGEQPGGALIRRLEVFAAAFIAMLLMAVAAAGLLWLAWRAVFEQPTTVSLGAPWGVSPLARYIPAVVVWAAGWMVHWRIAEGWLAQPELRAQERHAPLRRLFLYLAVFIAVAFTLTNLSRLLYGFLLAALGDPRPGGQPLLLGAGRPLSWIAVFLPLWWYHWQVLRRDAAALPLGEPQAGIRRLYVYLMAALSLAFLATGLGLLFSSLVDIAAVDVVTAGRGPQLSDASLRAKVSFAATSVLVGLPVWGWHWGTAQRFAGDVTQGWLERRSLSRRIYLYLAIFAAVVTILGAGAAFLFQVLNALLGARVDVAYWRVLGNELGAVLVAAGILAYHVPVLRADLQATPAATVAPEAAPERVRLVLTVEVPATVERSAVAVQVARALGPDGRVLEVVRQAGTAADTKSDDAGTTPA
jgi:hypothetical protein